MTRSMVGRLAATGILLGGLFLGGLPMRAAPEDLLRELDRIEVAALEDSSRGRSAAALERYIEAFQRIGDRIDGLPAERRPLLRSRAEVYLHRLGTIAGQLDAYAEGLEAVTSLREHDVGEVLRARLDYAEGNFLFHLGRIDDGDAAFDRLGFVQTWFVIGPFDNPGGTGGFAGAYPPEEKLDLRGEYFGQRNQVTWRRTPVRSHTGYVDLNTLIYPNDQVVAYAAAWLRSPEEQDVALRIGSDEGVRVWLNGAEVLSRDVHRDAELDQDVFGVRMAAGWNLLLLKVVEDRGPWGFRLRVTTPAGAPLVLETCGNIEEAARISVPAPLKYAGDAPDRGAVATLETILDADPKNSFERFHLGELLMVRSLEDRDSRRKKEELEKALFLEESPHIAYLAAQAAQVSAAMSAERQEHEYRLGLEKVLELDPEHLEAALDLAQYYQFSMQNLSRAAEFLKRAQAVNPDCPELRQYEMTFLRARGLSAEADRIQESLRADARGRSEVKTAQSLDLLAAGRFDRAADVACAVIASDYLDARARDVLLEVANRTDQVEAAEGLFAEKLRLNPYDLSALTQHAHLLGSRMRFGEAAAEIRAALEISPQNEDLWETLGRYLHLAGNDEAAFAAWDRSLQENPNQVALRQYVEFLQTHLTAWEEAYREDGREILAREASWEPDPEAAAAALLDLTVTRVRPDGTRSEYSHVVVRILSEQGCRDFDQYRIGFSRGEQRLKVLVARVIHADGSIEESRIDTGSGGSYGAQGVDLPPLDPGDTVDIEYRLDDLAQSFFQDYFGKIVYFGGTYPVRTARYVLLGARDKPFYFRTRNMDIRPDTEDLPEGLREWTWVVRDIARVISEPAMPPAEELVPTLRISTFDSWDSLAVWYWNLIRRQQDLNERMIAKLRELTRFAETDEQKIRAVYDFVVSEIRYNMWEFGIHGYKPYRTSAIFENRFGDCKDKALLINVFLRELGFQTFPVLIKAEDGRGREDMDLPMFEYFNHCIAAVRAEDGSYRFLDGTATFWDADNLPAMDLGARVVVVRPDGGDLVQIPYQPAAQNLRREVTHVKIDGEGNAEVRMDLRVFGTRAADVRYRFLVPDQRSLILDRAWGAKHGGATVSDLEFSELKDLADPVHMAYSVRLPSLVESGETSPRFQPVLVPAEIAAAASKSERDHDLILANPWRNEGEIRFELDPSWEILEVPEDVKLEGPFGVYEMTFRSNGNTLSMLRSLEMRVTRVSVEDYPAFREFCTGVDLHDQAEVRLRKR